MLRRLLLASAIATALGDNYWANYSSLLRFQSPNGTTTFPDERGKVWTRNGNVVIQNNTAVFDGSGDYLRTPAHADFVFGKGDFTIEAYVYKTNYTGGGVNNDETIFGSYGAGSIAFLLDNTTGQPKTWDGVTATTSSIAVPLNKLTHVVWCRSNGVFRIFVDGEIGYEGVYPFNVTNITNPWSVGGNTYNDNTRYFSGQLAGVRVSREAIYTTEFTPPQPPFPTGRTVSLLHFDKDLQWDAYVKLMLHCNGVHGSTVFTESRFGTAVTRVGTPIISTHTAKFGGASLNISGDNNGLSVPGSWSLTEDGTVEGWVYLDSSVSGRTIQAFFGNRPMSGASNNNWTLYAQLSGGTWRLSGALYDSAQNISPLPITKVITLDKWHHIALERYNGVATAYLDGESAGSVAYTNTGTSTNPMLIGHMNVGGEIRRSLYGYIDEIRVTKGYARYKGGFTPPEHEFLQGERYFYDEKVRVWDYVGQAIVNETLPKFGEGSYKGFGGDTGYIKTTNVAELNVTNKEFTIEAFLYPFSYGQPFGSFIAGRDNPLANRSWRFLLNSTGTLTFVFQYGVNAGDTVVLSGGVVPIGVYSHVSVERVGDILQLYVNGDISGSVSIAGLTMQDTTNRLHIGSHAAEPPASGIAFNGYIDEFRITVGRARYRTSFVPPIQPFPHRLTG